MITFIKDIDLDKLRMAYNNDVLRFYNESTAPPVWAEVALRTPDVDVDLFRIRLYPNPQGQFFINLKPYITSLINTRDFDDTLETNLQVENPQSFIYNFTDGTFINKNLYMSIMHADGSHGDGGYSLSWLAGVEQHDEHTSFRRTDMLVLSPFKKETSNSYYLKYWQGYPFDMALYSTLGAFTVRNETNKLSQNFTKKGNVDRLVFSDGRTDETLESLLPFVEGINQLKISKSSAEKWITLEKVPYKCGVYLKWLNKYGGYSYWLFENTYSKDRSTKQLGELDRDSENIENSFGRTVQIGKESQDTLRIVAELLTDDERRIVEGIIDSPKIYLFTGSPFSRNSYNNWTEVTLKTTNTRIKNPKQPLTNFTFDIELPLRYTQTL